MMSDEIAFLCRSRQQCLADTMSLFNDLFQEPSPLLLRRPVVSIDLVQLSLHLGALDLCVLNCLSHPVEPGRSSLNFAGVMELLCSILCNVLDQHTVPLLVNIRSPILRIIQAAGIHA